LLPTWKTATVLARAAALCLWLAACGGGGGDGGGPTPFPTQQIDDLPPGTRIDVSRMNLFPLGAGDFWSYNVTDGLTELPTGTTQREVIADDGAGHVALEDDDEIVSVTPYTITADGLLNTQPLGDIAPAAAASIAGAILDYATPLYPIGAVRRHVRSGPWGEDLDGDGIGESFRFEYTQVFLGFETMQLSANTLSNVAHFHNVSSLTIRATRVGDVSAIFTEDAWFVQDLGLVRSQRGTTDAQGGVLDSPHTLVFNSGLVSGAVWDMSEPPPPIQGSVLDVPLTHNALVYSVAGNVYYASVPGSVPSNGNRIATIDPATGQVSYSGTVGSEPDALALSADGSVLYVVLDGTKELAKLTPPAMTELGRVSLGNGASAITISPADPEVVAASGPGVRLFRSLVVQPKQLSGGDLAVFDTAGTTLYSMVNSTLSRSSVVADGVVQDLVLNNNAFQAGAVRALSLASDRIIAGHWVYNAPDLSAAGVAPSQGDCRPQRSVNRFLCLSAAEGGGGQSRMLVVDGDTFVIKAFPLYEGSESAAPRRFVEGPAGQVAISYQANASGFVSKIRLFSSADLVAPPALAPPALVVTPTTTRDGSALSIGIPHGALVFDSGRNVYYASVPGTVAGFGNSIATIDPAGQIAYSAPVGSEPHALAIAADGSALYVGLDGSGEVLKLALPLLSEQGRARLPVDPSTGQADALAIAVSPADSSVAAVATTPGAAGASIVLLDNMVMQSAAVTGLAGANQLAFDSAGTTLYGLNDDNGILDQSQVGPGGLTLQNEIRQSLLFQTDALSLASNRVIVGAKAYDAPALTLAGTIPNAFNCWATRSGTSLLCFSAGGLSQGTMLVANAATLTAGPTFIYSLSERNPPAALVQGPPGQVAIDYNGPLNAPSILLFSSANLP
jgi:DNA-binding beta-propeller fold protein YncE